jgi:hypothetical protein
VKCHFTLSWLYLISKKLISIIVLVKLMALNERGMRMDTEPSPSQIILPIKFSALLSVLCISSKLGMTGQDSIDEFLEVVDFLRFLTLLICDLKKKVLKM